ncbi:DNA-binding transcriptional regulator, MarR family [Meinhardsimonia xiamenensis]|jgi:DNA-binding MarR family transcriptional regulator|uniref:DNA-binding transcriptional regulator, MarR family n=1 Tax=Meinhardsimonia xiamenensis TaxID=990712 RepID=A0A1G9AAZ2_9RHOB|nr:MarR family winged helix-turn-helix transcriptional regulator [Meinhardsimonia xiamenensis]PRX35462.1 DNA-binding MarR family transcriptional regulator [Meinhardsimonia xiamenensis]SDK24516.1 DNA-binding transcriptional regulator, MarR family [Meinhardsimonia xiamenensis]
MTRFVLDDFLPYQLAVLAERTSREFSALYRERFGISIPEWRVVAHLSQAGTVSVREIHARVAMDKSKVSRAAARLEAAGYITKTVDPRDRRLVALSLTEKGRAMMEEIAPLAEAFQAEFLARLGARAEDFREALAVLLEPQGKDEAPEEEGIQGEAGARARAR